MYAIGNACVCVCVCVYRHVVAGGSQKLTFSILLTAHHFFFIFWRHNLSLNLDLID